MFSLASVTPIEVLPISLTERFSKVLSSPFSDPEAPGVQRTNSGTQDGGGEQEGMGRGPTEDDERWTDRPPDGTEQGRLAGRHGRPQQHAPHVRERSQRRCDLLFTPNTTSPGNILASFSLALRYRRQSAKISGFLCYCFVFYYNYFFIHSFLLLFLLILPAPASPVLPSFPLPSSTHMYVRCRQLFFFFHTSIFLYVSRYNFLPVFRLPPFFSLFFKD